MVTELGIVKVVRFWHQEKASSPIVVTELDIVTLVREQLLKALFPIVVTESGIVIELRERPKKEESPIILTDSGIIVYSHPAIRVLVAVWIMALQLLRLSYIVLPLDTVIFINEVQRAKIPIPILLTESGIVIEVSPVHPKKAFLPIVVTELGIAIEVSPVHPEKAL